MLKFKMINCSILDYKIFLLRNMIIIDKSNNLIYVIYLIIDFGLKLIVLLHMNGELFYLTTLNIKVFK